jgi:hypothetical protein
MGGNAGASGEAQASFYMMPKTDWGSGDTEYSSY